MKKYINRGLLEKERFDEYGIFAPLFIEKTLDLFTLITNGTKRILLLGDAGYGKSTELKYLVSKFIKEENPNFIPVIIELNTYDDEDIEKYVSLKIGEDSRAILKFDKSKIVFLFDEFDQVLDKGKAERKIRNFIEQYNESTFVITCRTNIYTGQFNGFNTFILLPFNSKDIEEYAQILGAKKQHFLELLDKYGIHDLAENPFFLESLLDIYNTDENIPSNRGKIFSRVITLALEKDECRLRDKYDLKQNYPIADIERNLMYLSLVMETYQKNYLTIDEFNQVIPDSERKHIIIELSVIKKSFTKEGDVIQFQHNNIQEFLAARRIADCNKNIILEFITFTLHKKRTWLDNILNIITLFEISLYGIGINIEKIVDRARNLLNRPRFDQINPSWLNTVSFLIQLREKDDLKQYLLEKAPELCIKFETSRIEPNIRERIFKNVFEKYTKRVIWLDWEKVRDKDLANFGRSRGIYNYLKGYAHSRKHFIERYNAIEILGWMGALANGDNELHNLLIQYAKDENENINVRHSCLRALAQLRWNDAQTIESLKELKDSNKDLVLSGLFYLIKESDRTDDYVDILLDGIKHARGHTLVDVSLNLIRGIEQIKSVEGVRKIVEHFTKHPGYLDEFSIGKSLDKIINNTIEAYTSDKTIYNAVKNLIRAVHNKYMHQNLPNIKLFFQKTETTLQLFKDIYDEGFDDNRLLLVRIADSKCFEYIVEEFTSGKLTEDNLIIFNNLLYSMNRVEYDSFIEILKAKTGRNLTPPPSRYEEEQKLKLKRKIQIIFDKREFILEVEKIYRPDRVEISYNDLEKILTEEWAEETHNHFVVIELLNALKEDKERKWKLEELKTEIDRWDYQWVGITRFYNLYHHDTDLEINNNQIKQIQNYCNDIVGKININKTLKLNYDLAVILGFFMTKLNFTYPKEIMLDMLSFGNIEGLDYLIEHIPAEDVKKRILKNLKERTANKQALEKHIEYCIKYKVEEAKEVLCKLIEDKGIQTNLKLLALKAIVKLDISKEYLETLLETDEFALFFEVAKYLKTQKSKKLTAKLLNYLKSTNKEFALESAKLLVEEDNINAIKYYANYLKGSEITMGDLFEKSPLLETKTAKALPVLYNLLEHSHKTENNNLLNLTIPVFTNIALQSPSNLMKVKNGLKNYTQKMGLSQNKINYLLIVSDNIEKAFFANYTSRIDIDGAKEKVDKLLKEVPRAGSRRL